MSAPKFLEVAKWDDAQAKDYFEKIRWPDGPRCPKCGSLDHWTINRRNPGKNQVTKLYRCKACKKQYTVTVGTIFEDSHIPFHKWMVAIHLMCSSKKGMSALQIARELDMEKSYRHVWFMCHRIREAMRDKSFAKLSGTVEADETYLYPKRPRGHPVWKERIKDEIEMGLRPPTKRKSPYADKPMVFGILERGGSVRTMVATQATAKELQPLIRGFVDVPRTHLMTDGAKAYKAMGKEIQHDVVDHELTYVAPGDVHTQNIDGYWSLLKRGLYGTFHHVNVPYLPSYLNEFEYRFNRRGVSDSERFASLMEQTKGRVTWNCETPLAENPYA